MKSEKPLKEIVNTRDSQKHIMKIVENFLNAQKVLYGNEVSRRSAQYTNIVNLTKLLYCKNREDIGVIVADLDMAQGKSSLLVEFIKYMYEYDEEFGCMVVKKTLEECRDFCVDLGCSDEYGQEDIKARKTLYDDGKSEDKFIARTIRGFNFKDCDKYKDKKGWFGKTPDNAVDYDFRLCRTCRNVSCPVKLSKSENQKHRVITITHNRLFFSTDYTELIDNLLCFENNVGKQIKRKLLVIDEKIDTTDIRTLTWNQFLDLKKLIDNGSNDTYIKLFEDIEKYLKTFEFPQSRTSPIKIVPREKVRSFEFDDGLFDVFYKDRNVSMHQIQNLMTLESILCSYNLTTSLSYPSASKQITYHKYIDLSDYAKEFKKTIILDATSSLDEDYSKSDIVFCEDIKHKKQHITLYQPNKQCVTSKTRISGSSIKEYTREYYNNNVNLIGKEIENIIDAIVNNKTLIVVYKEVDNYEFKNDIKAQLKEFGIKHDYKVIHHGQYSTGVNHLRSYTNIIIVGQLHKSHTYYQNKALAVGKDIGYDEKIKVNDYLIQTIQQIGRTALRENKQVNVFVLADEPELLIKLKAYFKTKTIEYDLKYFKHETKIGNLLEFLDKALVNKGERIAKSFVAEEVGCDESYLRNPEVKAQLEQRGIVTSEDNIREFVKC